ncbi:hypothetical protein EJ05DRAFT_512987 [Pseudovirgaria hyperparasitica]|uniref:Regulatory P domain-containing protein n=1 Tax=Pseudovirgaria hyperparasitica TaxID=470096 RepID=A0A6A6VXU2_9PEZI|nr:uncharacterized protein EJ05DRAFT_512987 [Pseudovirgaria hyperparasitica]KAF2755478.1 hypothetical protein EJ05DRAFT_512987 [Pseudovirgaria hyperparasitica]
MYRLATFAALAGSVLCKEKPKDFSIAADKYDSGTMHMEIMATKRGTFQRQRDSGAMNSEQYIELPFANCRDGKAQPFRNNATLAFRCNNLNLHHFLSHAALGSATGEGSSSWGWTSDDGREFIAIAQADGAAFAQVTTAGKLEYLGRLPKTSAAEPEIWREIRGYNNYMIIGSEAEKHNIQIFDMTKLLDLDNRNPVTFNPDTDVTGIFTDLPIGRTHNVVANPASGFAYSVGAAPRTDKCRSGLIAIDMSDPAHPTSPGCAAIDGYVHDAQCLMYKGPDAKYAGREICYGYNEDSLSIYDMSDKLDPHLVSVTSYDGAAYTHQGWVLDPDWQEYLIMDDEYDEFDRVGPAADGHPVTYIWDISELERPRQTGYYKSTAYSVDHNQYIAGKYAYQSNYGSGFRILDVSSIPADPTGAGVKEVAFFDVYPEDDAEPNGGVIDFVGTWSSYALFESGFIVVNTIERGAFVLKVQSLG